MLYIFNTKTRKTPLIIMPYSDEAKELYLRKGYIVKEEK